MIHGSSGTEVKHIFARLDQPALFWLDGLSGGITAGAVQYMQIMQELLHIFETEKRDHVIVIDDARLFGVDPAYPTVQEVDTYARLLRNNVEISVIDDSIRILPIWGRIT